MHYGLDAKIFKTQDGHYEVSGSCHVRIRDRIIHKNESYPFFDYDQDLKILACKLIDRLKYHHGRNELDGSLEGTLTVQFSSNPEIFYPFPNGVSRMRLPLSREEIVEFWNQLNEVLPAK